MSGAAAVARGEQLPIAAAGEHADVYALWGETYEQVRELISRVRGAAVPFGRTPNTNRP
jgi:alkanesulfonate monooxygenase SsuD/methylene tetrahydromethanopterin reductase-like flavin-dependent oxidoreductase (luciferase family)